MREILPEQHRRVNRPGGPIAVRDDRADNTAPVDEAVAAFADLAEAIRDGRHVPDAMRARRRLQRMGYVVLWSPPRAGRGGDGR